MTSYTDLLCCSLVVTTGCREGWSGGAKLCGEDMWAPSQGKSGLSHASSLRPQASSVYLISGHSRGWFVQAWPAMRPAASRCQPQAQPAMNQTAGNPLATFLSAVAYHILCGGMHAMQQRPLTRPAGLNLRAGAASWATPLCPPPRGLARPLHYAHARRNCWAQGRCRQALCRCCSCCCLPLAPAIPSWC